jgi:thiol-disulfide isomerase/thioredoxin
MSLLHKSSVTAHWLLATLFSFAALTLVAIAVADEPAAGEAPTEVPADAPKGTEKETSDAGGDSADDLLKKLADADRDLKVVLRDLQRAAQGKQDQALQLDDDQRKELQDAVALIVKTGEALSTSKTATEQQIERGQLMVARTLNSAATFGGEEFAKQFDDYVDRLVKEFPKSAATELGVAQRFVRKYLSGDPQPEALDELVKFAEQFPDNVNRATLFRVLGAQWSQAGDAQQAIAVYEKGIELLGDTRGADLLKAPLRNLQIIGKPMEVKGPTPDDQHVDLADYKGKLVLIDFWGTWCGPCVGEIPNIKAVYDKYHDAGFDVIGVNVLDDRDTLKKFLTDNDVRWQQIQFVDEKGKAQTNKVAEQYEIHSFPSTFLIGRDGNVLAVDVRGEALEKQVEKHIKDAAAGS